MIEITGNLFDFSTYRLKSRILAMEPDALCISTNGYVKRTNGAAVMGRGCAKQAADLYPELPIELGKLLTGGNCVHETSFYHCGAKLVTVPVKPVYGVADATLSNIVAHRRACFKPDDKVPGWACVASKKIILKSAAELHNLTTKNNWNCVVLPRLGCGFGELIWEEVKVVMSWLDDRFYVIDFGK